MRIDQKKARVGWAMLWLLVGWVGTNAWAQPPLTGTIKPLDDLKLSLPIAGRIEVILVKEGQPVKKGMELLHLDKSQEELEVKRRQLVWEDHAKLDESRARERILRDQVTSARALLATNTISRKQLEDEELALAAAVSEHQALEAAKQREKVEYDLARDALARRFLHAPMDGVVVKIHFQVGESIAANDTVIRLVDVSRIYFTGNLDSQSALRIQKGDAVKVRFGTDDHAEVRQGNVVFVSPVADLASGLVEVKVEFSNADGTIRPGIVGQILLGTE
ncbi:MAG: efflux RND transporter periplasmic adaptor subunit [Magnetococcales bacterium]|nr:efflux RND transporter periplasmic adaptor subunit [Magnetococcales bacterium]